MTFISSRLKEYYHIQISEEEFKKNFIQIRIQIALGYPL